ncbi:uncharacterized protein [Oscarella lobularis]|uniref:uncharacterized protein n=1 Tax=Oscarella lobularis TaxID=121494 RepID=UPI0033133483
MRNEDDEVVILPSGLKEVHDIDGASVRIYYLECLAQASYMISHDGNAILVDPRRDVDAYLQELNANELTLKGIFLTHVHADFVSGHKELQDRASVGVYMGAGAAERCQFQPYETKDNEIIHLSEKFSIRAVHTPGHTPESVTWILINKEDENKAKAAFTGDTLFIGSCGRPDLVGSVGYTAEEMAGLMFDSLNNKLKTLPDDTKVYPAHGAGSPCGKSLGAGLSSTIGSEKLTNFALQFQEKNAFVKFLTSGQPPAPSYFQYDVAQNLKGATCLADVIKEVKWLEPAEFQEAIKGDDVTILDSRRIEDYNAGHIDKALCFPAGQEGGAVVKAEEGNFAIWVGTLIQPTAKLAVVAYPDQIVETIQRLARIGYKVLCVLKNGMKGWEETASLPVIQSQRVSLKTNEDYDRLLENGVVIDIRTPSEFETDHAKSSVNVSLNELKNALKLFDKTKKYYAYCSSGYRSAIALSLMQSAGFDAYDIVNGFAGIVAHLPERTLHGKMCPSLKKKLEMLENK